jgi:hypothetical protein
VAVNTISILDGSTFLVSDLRVLFGLEPDLPGRWGRQHATTNEEVLA